LQQREFLIHDGNPPSGRYNDLLLEEEDEEIGD
jgi:phospholipid-binding lipoprotein MlaA